MKPAEFEYFAGFLRERSGVSLDSSKSYLVEARMASLVDECGLDSLSNLVSTLRGEGDSGLEARVVDEMMIAETSFFRDVRPFETLRSYAIPAVMESRGQDKKLRIWSAGCSTGQEPYSVAILIREHLPELADWEISIIATDLSSTVLEYARQASYSPLEINRGLPGELQEAHFTRSGLRWQLCDEIRSMVAFEQKNLLEPPGIDPPVDIVLLRNVLLYFDLDVQRRVLGLVKQSMQAGAFLFLGGTETTLNLDDAFEPIEDLPRSGCYRLGKE